MKSNLRIWLIIAAVIALVAGGLWFMRPTTPTPTPAPAKPSAGQDSAAHTELVPVAPPLPATPVALATPQTVTVVGGPPGDFVIVDPADGSKALRYAVETVGTDKAIATLDKSTWRLVLSGGMQRTATVQADLAHGFVLRDDETGEEIGWLDGTCWQAEGDVVLPCQPLMAGLARSLHWMMRAQLAAPLTSTPWKIAGANAQNQDGKLRNAVTLDAGGPIHAATGMVVVQLDARSRRVAQVVVTSSRKQADKIEGHLPKGTMEFSDPQSLGAVTVASTIKLTIGDYVGPDEVVIRLLDVHAGAQVPTKPRPTGWPKELRLGARPGGLGLLFEVGTHAKLSSELLRLIEKQVVHPLRLLQFQIVEAQAPLGSDNASGVQLWLVPRTPVALTGPGLQPHTKPLPAELAVAKRIAEVGYNEVPAEIAATLQAVEKAGYKPAPDRRTTVTYLANGEGETPKVTVEIAVPIAAP